jgi:hypothetical protein
MGSSVLCSGANLLQAGTKSKRKAAIAETGVSRLSRRYAFPSFRSSSAFWDAVMHLWHGPPRNVV